ncbi:phage portal protein [Sporosarcina sp. P17b]|uniref:phage portal protein n=1 Tax=Sporosarcina sp. P17b TaxID=2048260 RepID=UPI000C17197C|nr:phage portal protein [Sporosarcina sp. P17b]PIC73333.1 phage portal protein [Sporosarcina sp. P17b]
MYLFSNKTHGEELLAHLAANAPRPLPTEEIKKIYDAFNPKKMQIGIDYYLNKNDIGRRQIYAYRDGVKVVDVDASNERIPSGYHKILVDQKTAYLSGEPMVFSSKSGCKETMETIEELIGEKWEDVLPELIKGASNKGKEWLHPFIDEEGAFDYMLIPAETFIPIEDIKTGKLTAGIRFYDESEETVRLEVWTDTDVTYYVMTDHQVVLDESEEMNPAPHFTNADGTEWRSWGRVPFVEFANNNERIGDLFFYKEAIDAYDLLVSDAQNTLADMQSLIWALKGYTGEDLGEFMENLKRYKAVSLDLEGGIETVRAEVPVEAYKTQTDMLKENIYAFGQGVNPSPDVIGGAPSGVALKNLYSLLDMKASIMERKFVLALREFMWFIAEYCNETEQKCFDYRDILFTFNKLLLTNEAEIIDMAVSSQGIISEETLIENHPWVKDPEREKQRKKQEKKDDSGIRGGAGFNEENGRAELVRDKNGHYAGMRKL